MITVDHTVALLKAIRLLGTQSELARQLKVKRETVNKWLNRNKHIPFEYAMAIEILTDHQINCYELAPYARFLKKLKPINRKL